MRLSLRPAVRHTAVRAQQPSGAAHRRRSNAARRGTGSARRPRTRCAPDAPRRPGIPATIRLGYTPIASFDTLPALLATLQDDHPDLTVDARELYSAEIPERLRAGDLDVGLAMSPQQLDDLNSELLRTEPVAALGVVALEVTDAALIAELCLLWPTRSRSGAVTNFLDRARACATRNVWLPNGAAESA